MQASSLVITDMKKTEAEVTLGLAARLFILVPGAKMDAMASACPAARLKGRRIWLTGCLLGDRITVSRQTTIRQRESMIWFFYPRCTLAMSSG